jgi:hypothetical protein
MLKIVYMMIIAGRTLPRYPNKGEFMKAFVDHYTSKVGWKVSQHFEAALMRQKQTAEKDNKRKQELQKSLA